MSPGFRDTPAAGACLSGRLFVLSLSLLAAALLFDLVDLSTGTGALGLPAYWLTAAGVVLGIAAGLFRLWRLAPAGTLGSLWPLTALPGFFKAVAIALCAGGWSLRTVEGDAPLAALAMALAGVLFAFASRFLPAAADEEGGGMSGEEEGPAAAAGAGAVDARTAREPAARAF